MKYCASEIKETKVIYMKELFCLRKINDPKCIYRSLEFSFNILTLAFTVNSA